MLVELTATQVLALQHRLNSRDFYDLMQRYRHTPFEQLETVAVAYSDVKRFILYGSLPDGIVR
jgi:hypothetical protein